MKTLNWEVSVTTTQSQVDNVIHAIHELEKRLDIKKITVEVWEEQTSASQPPNKVGTFDLTPEPEKEKK